MRGPAAKSGDVDVDSEQPFSIRVYSAAELTDLELPQAAEPVTPHTRRAMITLLGGITGHGKSTWSAHEIRQAALDAISLA